MKLDYEPEKLNEEVRNSLPNLNIDIECVPQDLVSLDLFLVFGLSRRRARRRTEDCTTRFSSIDGTTSLWGSTAKVVDFLWCLGDGAYTSFWSSRGADGRTRIEGLFLVFGLLARRARRCTED